MPVARIVRCTPAPREAVPGAEQCLPALPFVSVTAKQQLRERVEALTEEQAAETLRLLDQRTSYPSVFPARPGRPATAAEFEAHFGDLPFDDEP